MIGGFAAIKRHIDCQDFTFGEQGSFNEMFEFAHVVRLIQRLVLLVDADALGVLRKELITSLLRFSGLIMGRRLR